MLRAPKLSTIQQTLKSRFLRSKDCKGYLGAATRKFDILCMKSEIAVLVQRCAYLYSAFFLAYISLEVRKAQWPHGYCARIWSRYEPWPGTLCCLLGQDTLLLQLPSPLMCIVVGTGESSAGRQPSDGQ